MEKLLLGDLVTFQRGFDLPKEKIINGQYPVVSSNSIIGYHNKFKSSSSIVIGRSGSIGKPQLILSNFWPHNTALYIKDFKNNNILYIYYFLLYFNTEKLKTGSNIPTLNRNHLHKLNIYVETNVNKQKIIADILYKIDKQIILNNKTNSELEQMAKTLYNYWFVQFDFPDENGRPYKSSGGKMVWNEELKKEIPEGWEVKSLHNLVSINKVKMKPDKEKLLIDLSVMPTNSISLNILNQGDILKSNLFKMDQFDILFGSIRPYLLKAGFAPIDGLVAGTIHSISPLDDNHYNFLLLTFCSRSLFNYAIQSSKGTRMPVISIDNLLNYKIPFSLKIASKFNKILNFKEIVANNIVANQELTSLREFLLPLLMNGQALIKE